MPILTTAEKASYDAMVQPHSEYTLTGAAPKMIMDIESPNGVGADMAVKFGTRTVAQMQWDKVNQEFVFQLYDKDSGVSKATFAIKQDGKAYLGTEVVMTESSTDALIREFRTTITHNIADHAKPTLAECKTTFKLLPHFDWKKDDDYYIKDSTGGKIVLIKYRSTPAATEAAPGNFFYEILTKAK